MPHAGNDSEYILIGPGRERIITGPCRSTEERTMPYAGKDFGPFDADESVFIGFDFAKSFALPSDVIVSGTFAMADTSDQSDISAFLGGDANHVVSIVGTVMTTSISDSIMPGTRGRVVATAVSSISNEALTLYAFYTARAQSD